MRFWLVAGCRGTGSGSGCRALLVYVMTRLLTHVRDSFEDGVHGGLADELGEGFEVPAGAFVEVGGVPKQAVLAQGVQAQVLWEGALRSIGAL
ncbi:hypothetical protein ACWCW2_42510 [Streptomyces sp. NPDC001773]|uniref:hypothetical protein n=1 Tax=Streptomyces sp. NPDC005499 TaxID=3154883 RepID=UPI0033BEC1C0